MANFRVYKGIFIKLLNDVSPVLTGKQLKTGEEYQVLSVNGSWGTLELIFVGVKGRYRLTGKDMEPIYE